MNDVMDFTEWKQHTLNVLNDLGLQKNKKGMYRYCSDHSDLTDICDLPILYEEFKQLTWKQLYNKIYKG